MDTKEATSSKVQLPAPEEIPNIDLQVVNYHRIVVGTLHSKFMIVDRKLALLESNNIQVCSISYLAMSNVAPAEATDARPYTRIMITWK